MNNILFLSHFFFHVNIPLRTIIDFHYIFFQFHCNKIRNWISFILLKEGKGYIKLYNKNNILLKEYEFINGLKNGFWKEYLCGKLNYEGEYLNGKRNGKGKEYYRSVKLKFEGEYLKGKEWNGKGYLGSNNIIYELKNGNGYVKKYNFNDKLYFEGEYLRGEINGKGIEYNTATGKIKFEGEFRNGQKNGKGKEYDKGDLVFEGEYLNGQKNGRGKEYNKGKLIFEGEYLYDYKIRGKEYKEGRLVYEGDYLFDKKWNGKGYDENGNIVYELINGSGSVKEYNSRGELEFEGVSLNGKRNGKGKEYKNGKLKFEGEFLNGKR